MKKVFLVMALVVAGLVLVSGQVFAENGLVEGAIDPVNALSNLTVNNGTQGTALDLDTTGSATVLSFDISDNHEVGWKLRVQSANGIGTAGDLYLKRYDVLTTLTANDTNTVESQMPYTASWTTDPVAELTANGLTLSCDDGADHLNADGDCTYTATGPASLATVNWNMALAIDWTADNTLLEGYYHDTITLTLTPRI